MNKTAKRNLSIYEYFFCKAIYRTSKLRETNKMIKVNASPLSPVRVLKPKQRKIINLTLINCTIQKIESTSNKHHPSTKMYHVQKDENVREVFSFLLLLVRLCHSPFFIVSYLIPPTYLPAPSWMILSHLLSGFVCSSHHGMPLDDALEEKVRE